jgi:hypothetical protein
MEATAKEKEITMSSESGRTVAGIVNSIETLEGGGFLVRRPFPKPTFSEFDPFLLLDEMGPMTVGPNQAKGAPDHPHRGFETVTYMLSGEMEHKDSHGHAGKLRSWRCAVDDCRRRCGPFRNAICGVPEKWGNDAWISVVGEPTSRKQVNASEVPGDSIGEYPNGYD